jgi:hypothetical protein
LTSAGGLKKGKSPDFLAAEEQLFAEQCKDVDILITTAVNHGKLPRSCSARHSLLFSRNALAYLFTTFLFDTG